MPRVTLLDPFGTAYTISTRRQTTLFAWFDEILPHVNRGLADDDRLAARIQVFPEFRAPDGKDADWFADSRVLGRLDAFPFQDAMAGMKGLAVLQERVARELEQLNRERESGSDGD